MEAEAEAGQRRRGGGALNLYYYIGMQEVEKVQLSNCRSNS